MPEMGAHERKDASGEEGARKDEGRYHAQPQDGFGSPERPSVPGHARHGKREDESCHPQDASAPKSAESRPLDRVRIGRTSTGSRYGLSLTTLSLATSGVMVTRRRRKNGALRVSFGEEY